MSLLSRRWRQRNGSEEQGNSDEDTSSPVRGRNGKGHISPNPYSTENGGGSGGASASGSAGGGRLAQEIHDEFLVCKICLDVYKNPKCLTCLHTFCEQCIENHINSESTYKKYSDYREFTCPLCRKRTQLPMGGVKKLPDNFLVSSLTEVVGRQKPSTYPFCDICKTVNKKQREAQSKCLDCGKLLCSSCVDLHKETKVTSTHSLFDVEIEKDIECKEHKDEVVRFYCEPCDACICVLCTVNEHKDHKISQFNDADEVVRFYCEPCDACICVLCTFNEHKDHEISQFTDAVDKHKKSIGSMLDKCNDKIKSFDQQVDALDKCEEIIKGVQQRVHDTAIEFIQDVRNKEKQLIEELENIYGADCMERVVNRKNTNTQVEGLRSTCSLTQVILSGKDIELLLLKKDVEEKLNSLSTVAVKSLPATVNKVVEFVAGSVDFGYIHDHERPLLSKMRKKFSKSSMDAPDYYPAVLAAAAAAPQMSTIETQTDPNITKLKARAPNSLSSSSESSSSSSSSSSSGSSSDDSDSSSSDSESEEEKKTEESGVQTDKQQGTDGWTMTEAVETEEKYVNTAPLAAGGLEGSNSLSNSTEDLSDNSLAARRRRRRERAQTSYTGGSGGYSGGYQSFRSGSSLDDGYYDSSNLGSKYSMRH